MGRLRKTRAIDSSPVRRYGSPIEKECLNFRVEPKAELSLQKKKGSNPLLAFNELFELKSAMAITRPLRIEMIAAWLCLFACCEPFLASIRTSHKSKETKPDMVSNFISILIAAIHPRQLILFIFSPAFMIRDCVAPKPGFVGQDIGR